jgi:glycosyltransferase involved in cell wall biosynthesis
MPMISGIMPVYNCADFVTESVQSVLDQTENDFELLIMDDCSTDGTLGRLKSFDDPRIRVFTSDRNIGQANQLNKGILLAKGEYIAIVHGDDINHPERFSAQLALFGKDPEIGIVGTWIEYFGSREGEWEAPVDPQDCLMELLIESPLAHPTVMIRRERLQGLEGVYKQDMVPAEDYDLWVRLSTSCKMSNVPRKLLKYRVHDQQISLQKAGLLKEKIDRIRGNLVALFLKDADPISLEVLEQLWDFRPGALMSYTMIRNCSSLSVYFADKNTIGRGKAKAFFDQWLFRLFLITGNYDRGVGFYFLFSRPSYFFRKKGADLARILFRSLYGKTRLFLS